MPFIRSKAGHEACSARIQKYLERDGRAVAEDFVNIHPQEQNRWAEAMDGLRRFAGNDKPVRGNPAVTYQHFVISPDPKDGVSLEALREFATEWAEENFGYTSEFGYVCPGKLGTFQVAIAYHTDNANGIPHAHVIVSNTDVDTLKRLHIDSKRYNELYARTQEMAKERGWSHFAEAESARGRSAFSKVVTKERYLTKEERSLRKAGIFSWKQDLAEHVHVARRISRDEAEFVDALRDMGVGVRLNKAGNDYVFAHPCNPKLWSSTGYRLGKAFSKESIDAIMEENAARGFKPERWVASGATLASDADRLTVRASLAHDSSLGRPRDAELRKAVIAAALSTLPEPGSCTHASLTSHGGTVVSLNKVLRFCEDEWVRCYADFDRVATVLEGRLAGLEPTLEFEDTRKGYEQRLENIYVAKRLALKLRLFENVPDTPKWLGPSKFTPLMPQNAQLKHQPRQRQQSHSQPLRHPPTQAKTKGRSR